MRHGAGVEVGINGVDRVDWWRIDCHRLLYRFLPNKLLVYSFALCMGVIERVEVRNRGNPGQIGEHVNGKFFRDPFIHKRIIRLVVHGVFCLSATHADPGHMHFAGRIMDSGCQIDRQL